MKTQIILSQNVGNETIYTHSISVEINDAITTTFGRVIGQLAHRFYKQIVITKTCGSGKGLSLRNPFDIRFVIDGKILVDTMLFDEVIKSKIRVGLSAKAQSRFARLLAVTLYNGLEDIQYDAMCDLLDESNSFTAETLMSQVRELLDCDIKEII